MLKFWPITIIIILTSCSTYSKKQCEQFDWEKIGEGIASEGYTYVKGISYYQRKCTEKHDIEIDVFEFSKGYRAGVNEFCKSTSAIIYGLKGKNYSGICPQDKEKRFLASYKKGLNQYLLNTVDKQKRKIKLLKLRLAKVSHKLKKHKKRNTRFKKISMK